MLIAVCTTGRSAEFVIRTNMVFRYVSKTTFDICALNLSRKGRYLLNEMKEFIKIGKFNVDTGRFRSCRPQLRDGFLKENTTEPANNCRRNNC